MVKCSVVRYPVPNPTCYTCRHPWSSHRSRRPYRCAAIVPNDPPSTATEAATMSDTKPCPCVAYYGPMPMIEISKLPDRKGTK